MQPLVDKLQGIAFFSKLRGYGMILINSIHTESRYETGVSEPNFKVLNYVVFICIEG
jgi:hypothetical protein